MTLTDCFVQSNSIGRPSETTDGNRQTQLYCLLHWQTQYVVLFIWQNDKFYGVSKWQNTKIHCLLLTELRFDMVVIWQTKKWDLWFWQNIVLRGYLLTDLQSVNFKHHNLIVCQFQTLLENSLSMSVQSLKILSISKLKIWFSVKVNGYNF